MLKCFKRHRLENWNFGHLCLFRIQILGFRIFPSRPLAPHPSSLAFFLDGKPHNLVYVELWSCRSPSLAAVILCLQGLMSYFRGKEIAASRRNLSGSDAISLNLNENRFQLLWRVAKARYCGFMSNEGGLLCVRD